MVICGAARWRGVVLVGAGGSDGEGVWWREGEEGKGGECIHNVWPVSLSLPIPTSPHPAVVTLRLLLF